MAIESHSVPTSIVDNDLQNRSISELVSILRTSFLENDFDQVEQALVANELKMRKEIENTSKEFKSLKRKIDFLKLDNLARGSLLQPPGFAKSNESENEIRALKELIVRVDEDRQKKMSAMEGLEISLEAAKKTQEDDRMIIEKLRTKNLELECAMQDREKTIEELRCENFKLECSMEELRCRKSELERTVEVVKKTEEDDWKCIEELKCENSKLECAKREAEHHYDLCKRKYDELWHRVSQLENRNLVGKKGAANEKSENRAGAGRCMVEVISDDDDHAPVENLSRSCKKQKKKWNLLVNDCEGYGAESERDDDKITILPSEAKVKESCKKVGAMFTTTPPHGRSDNHVLKRHFSPGTGDSENARSSSRAAAVTLRVEYSDGDIQNRYDLSRLKSKDPEKRYTEKWKAEAEMRAAFDENDLLCMEAVCILYKRSSSIGNLSSALPSRQRGFNEADMVRGSTLALFLTSGDSKGTLKKSVMELNNFDIGGLIDCRSIAIKYLKQLFEIYKNNEDQFLFQ